MPDKHLQKYRRVLAEKFPALAVESLEYVSEGWMSVAVLVNHHLIFRFPKRAEAAADLRVEMSLLPVLAPMLPVKIPSFEYIAEEGGRAYPFAFVGYERLPGLAQEDWPDEVAEAHWWRPPLGEFLTTLHAFPLELARAAGVLDNRATMLPEPGRNWRETLNSLWQTVQAQVFPRLSEAQRRGVIDRFEAFLGNDRFFQFEPVLLHADLWDDHVLLDLDNRRLSAIIDWGDVCIGDPAYDVDERVLPYYGGRVDETFLERRRFYWGLHPIFAILFGQQHNDAALIEFGLYGLDF